MQPLNSKLVEKAIKQNYIQLLFFSSRIFSGKFKAKPIFGNAVKSETLENYDILNAHNIVVKRTSFNFMLTDEEEKTYSRPNIKTLLLFS